MRIVVIGPYSHEDPEVRRSRERKQVGYGWHLGRAGYPASVLVAGAEARLLEGGSMDFEHWRHVNDPRVLAADQVHLLKLPGWDTSRGVAHELRLATGAGKRVLWVDPRDGGYWLAGTEMPVLEAIAQEVEA